MPKTNQIVGTIHLYGTSRVGFGWLATAKIGKQSIMFGDGEPNINRNATSAVWLAAEEITLRTGGAIGYAVEIHQDTAAGPRMAVAPLSRIPYFGDLEWKPAPVYEISADALIAASEVPA